MTTQIFSSAKDAKFLKIQPREILEINGYDVTKGYINITNKHVTVEDAKGVKVFNAPFEIKFKMKPKQHGGSRPNSGRKTRKEKGLEPTVTVTTSVEQSVIDKCKEKHGSLPNALRWAANSESKAGSLPD